MSKKQTTPKVKTQSEKSSLLIRIGAILLLTFIVYYPSLKNGFTNWDDNVYIGENKLIQSVSSGNIKQIFETKNHVSLNYHPVTILSLAIDYKLSKYNPHTYHSTNLFFHLANTALVFLLIYFLTQKNVLASTITSLVFAIHPMHVESVAWVAERKDVLYVFFLLLSAILYQLYINKNNWLHYFLSFALFVLACLSKAMAVVLPLVLLLMDYYMGRKITVKTVLEKIPFFVVSIVVGLLAVKIQSQGAIAEFSVFTLTQRICFTSYGFIFYIAKFFVPLKLSCYYPYPNYENVSLPLEFYISPFLVAALIIGVLFTHKKTNLYVFSLLFYIITIALVLQFISVGQVITADRYSYLPYLGLAFPVSMLIHKYSLNNSISFKKIVLPSLFVVLFLFSFITYNRISVWKNGDTLWSDAISKYPHAETYRNRGSYLVNKAAYDLGQKKVEENEYDRALDDFNKSVAISQKNPKVFTNRANIFGLKGKFPEALQDYIAAIKLDSLDPQTYFNQGVTYGYMKQFDNAIKSYTKALRLQPDFPKAKFNRAYDFINSEKYDDAINDLNQLIASNSGSPDYYFYRAYAYLKLSKWQESLVDHNATLAINPNNANACFNRSVVNKALGNFQQAKEDALAAQRLGFAVEPSYLNELSK
jgi:protein O-mannosyl-transferase